jgi:hypothetical protein
MEPAVYLTIRQIGRSASYEALVGMVRASLEEAEGKPDLLCYCHQSAGPAWEAPCAKLRAELALASMLPLAFGQSGCLSFVHAFALTEWLLAAGPHYGALFVIAERSGAASSDGGSGQLYNVAIIEASLERGAYLVVRDWPAKPELWLATRRTASEPLLELKSCEPLLAPGTVIELAFRDGHEAHAITLRKE